MSLLDSVAGLMGQSSSGNGDGQAVLMEVVSGLLSPQGAGGGLAGLVQHFEQGGLGNVLNSWIGSGQNLPISADQLQSVLGQHPAIANALQQTGLNPSDLMGQLAQMLPQLVDQLTPGGQLPSGAAAASGPDLGSLVGGLMGGLLGR